MVPTLPSRHVPEVAVVGGGGWWLVVRACGVGVGAGACTQGEGVA